MGKLGARSQIFQNAFLKRGATISKFPTFHFSKKGDQDKFRNLSKEFSQLEDVVAGFNAYQQAQENLASAQEMLNEDDADMREMAQEEMKEAKGEIERLETELQVLLLPKDPNDDNNCFLEIRAGAG